MSILLKRLCLLVLAILVVAAPISESVAAGDAPLAGAAKKKKCKKKSKKAKKGKCKKKKAVGGGSPGLPGKPVAATPSAPPAPPAPPAPLLLQSLQLTENPLLGPATGSAQVTVNAPAPAGGQPVTLGSDDPSRATLPDSVHIAAGQTTASFPVATTAGPPATVTLTAAIPGSVRTAQLEIVDEADLSSVALDYECFPDTGQSYFGNVVALNVRTPAPAPVDLVSSDPFSLSVPSPVVVPADSSVGSFGVNTLLTTPSVTVTASFNGADRADTASIRDSGSPDPSASGLSMHPNSVVVGDPSTGTVSLDCEAPAGGTTVSLDAGGYAGVTVPASVVVPEGALSADFQVNTVVSATPGDVQITATAGAAVQATLTLRALGT